MLVRLVTPHTLHPTLRPAQACLFLDSTARWSNSVPRLMPCRSAPTSPLFRALGRGVRRSRRAHQRTFARANRRIVRSSTLACRRAARSRAPRCARPGAPAPHGRRADRPACRTRAARGHHPDLLLEDKGRAIALHYRCAGQLRAVLEREVEQLLERHGDVPSIFSPATACWNSSRPASPRRTPSPHSSPKRPFAGRTPVFAGDDLTDLHGFEPSSVGAASPLRWAPASPRWSTGLPGRAARAARRFLREGERSVSAAASPDLDLGVIGNCGVSALIDAEGALSGLPAAARRGSGLHALLSAPGGA